MEEPGSAKINPVRGGNRLPGADRRGFPDDRADTGLERGLHSNGGQAATAQPSDGAEMKIYLLMLLIGALFTAIHFTQVPDADAKPVSR
jgi:hypothetical protein